MRAAQKRVVSPAGLVQRNLRRLTGESVCGFQSLHPPTKRHSHATTGTFNIDNWQNIYASGSVDVDSTVM